MQTFFLSSPPLPRRSTHLAPSTSPHRRLQPTAVADRKPWPIIRAVQSALFYTPLAKFLNFNAMEVEPASEFKQRMRKWKRAKAAQKPKQIILVTGANGGSGRRVVRELLAAGNKVRCLTRSRERLDKALQMVGVDLAKEESASRVDVFVSDLYNIRKELFQGVNAVIGCTGVNVGPPDDIDRKKYFQGIEFFTPVIKEDSAENVEFSGVRNLMKGVTALLEAEKREEGVEVLEFSDVEKVKSLWGGVDDVVMGGVSESFVGVQGGALVFNGVVRTENSGGFCSIRTKDFDTALNLKGFEGLRLRVKGDGKRYKLIVRCEKKYDGRAHCFSFSTKKGEWMDMEAPFEEFNTVFRGKTVPNGPSLNPENVVAFQIMVSKFEYDGDLNAEFEAGQFELLVESIMAYQRADGVVLPRMVHVGSAGVTRVLRKAEFPDLEKQPPAVRLNNMLGRILNWKLAGEDLVRSSGVPYTIVRPCALTEKEPVGMEGLKLSQGDSMTGQISREDIAPFLVNALGNADLVGKTVEVAWKGEGEIGSGGIEQRLKDLKTDEEMGERSFADFPYIPKAMEKS